MPGSAAKCFKSDSNQFKSSKDHIDKKKAQTIYYNTQDSAGQEYKGPIFVTTGGFLGAVGGYDTENYDLKLNVAKGRAYSEAPCIIKTDTSNIIIPNSNNSCNNEISKCQIPNSTYELFEGPFLLKNSTNSTNSATDKSEICPLKSRQQYIIFDPSNITSTSYSFSKLANEDKLQNLHLNTRLHLRCQQLPLEEQEITVSVASITNPQAPSQWDTIPGIYNRIYVVNSDDNCQYTTYNDYYVYKKNDADIYLLSIVWPINDITPFKYYMYFTRTRPTKTSMQDISQSVIQNDIDIRINGIAALFVFTPRWNEYGPSIVNYNNATLNGHNAYTQWKDANPPTSADGGFNADTFIINITSN